MRQLNHLEKELLRTIKQNQVRNIIDLLDRYLKEVRVQINRNDQTTNLLFEIENQYPTEQEQRDLPNRVGNVTQLIITSVNLLELLNREGFIILFQQANEFDDEIEIGQGAENEPSINNNFPDNRISQLLSQFSTMQIIITPELESYVDNDFKTSEDLKHQQRIYVAWAGVGIAIIAVLVNIGFNIFNIICS